MIALRSFALVALILAAACGGPSDYNGSCAASSDCKSGLMCPTTGPMTGKCTISCTKDEQCTPIGGGVCTSDVCVPK